VTLIFLGRNEMDRQEVKIVVYATILTVLLIGGAFYAVDVNIKSRSVVAFKDGQEARQSGLPANANPYIGEGGCVANSWLKGWAGEFGKE
jgi:hypothetical protein